MAFDPDPLVREGIVLASIVSLLLVAGVILLVLRSLSLPDCRNCGFPSVRRVHSHHRPLDTFARACFLYPHRCQRCLHRFYCFGFPRVLRHSGSRSTAAVRR
jgi:hypothetical protein